MNLTDRQKKIIYWLITYKINELNLADQFYNDFSDGSTFADSSEVIEELEQLSNIFETEDL